MKQKLKLHLLLSTAWLNETIGATLCMGQNNFGISIVGPYSDSEILKPISLD